MQQRMLLAAALLLAAAAPAAAQRVISQGMSPDQVRGVFGDPARTRSEGDWSYWIYSNGCPNRCGSDDVVFFRDEHVVAAVLRTRARRIQAPPAADAIEDAGGAANAAEIRAQGADAGDAASSRTTTPMRVRVRGRSRDAQDAMGSSGAPARVGRIHVESGGRTIDRQTTSSSDASSAAGGTSTIIRSGDNATSGRPASAAPVGARGTANDTVTITQRGDDARAAREAEVRRTTVEGQPDTINARQRNREKSVLPRVVPRP